MVFTLPENVGGAASPSRVVAAARERRRRGAKALQLL